MIIYLIAISSANNRENRLFHSERVFQRLQSMSTDSISTAGRNTSPVHVALKEGVTRHQ